LTLWGRKKLRRGLFLPPEAERETHHSFLLPPLFGPRITTGEKTQNGAIMNGTFSREGKRGVKKGAEPGDHAGLVLLDGDDEGGGKDHVRRCRSLPLARRGKSPRRKKAIPYMLFHSYSPQVLTEGERRKTGSAVNFPYLPGKESLKKKRPPPPPRAKKRGGVGKGKRDG